MSDFFTRLGERALGLRPTLEPRLPGWFGPLRDGPPDLTDAATREGPTAPAAQTQPASPDRTAHAADEPSRPGPEHEHEHAPQAAAGGRDGAAPHTMSARPMDVVHDGTRPRPRAARAAGEAIDRVPHEPAGTRIADAPSFAPLVGDRGGHRGPAPAALAQGPIDAAAALRREAAPNVRVTIGRVEVRANLRADARAGTSMQARPPQEPTQSLADYLRNGPGGRRSAGGRHGAGGRNGSGGRE